MVSYAGRKSLLQLQTRAHIDYTRANSNENVFLWIFVCKFKIV